MDKNKLRDDNSLCGFDMNDNNHTASTTFGIGFPIRGIRNGWKI